ncbi:SCO7613 C-terminal domain-containing membrane protein [Nonomuraea sp. NPDC050663]|uniref:SCO7613 C-terminal domain-containing membrane protein n=1 Tax=Nonomuraea sp. NPDC050663 TaxID=3364370 RepID=UPI00379E966D
MSPVCPDCGAALPAAAPACPRCALTLTGPAAAELWQVDTELSRLRARQEVLGRRRVELIGLLRQQQPLRMPEPVRPVPLPPAPRPEVSRRTAQNTLLILGGLLMAVAAIVFTVVSWGFLGLAGRSAIMAALTAITLAVPLLLLKRGLNATAETIGVLGVALLLLDGYAARRVGLLPGMAGDDYAALLIGLVAAAAAGYARATRLKAPLPIAIVLAQIPLPLAAISPSEELLSGAFAVTAAVDVVIWFFVGGRDRAWKGAVEVVTAVCLCLTWTVAWLGALLSLGEANVAGALPYAMAYLLLAAVALFAAHATKAGQVAIPFAAAAGVPALAVLPRTALPDGWQVLPFVVAALAIALAATRLRPGLRRAGMISGAVLAGVAVLPLAEPVLKALFVPVSHLVTGGWSTVPAARPAVVAFLLLAAASWALTRRRSEAWWGVAGAGLTAGLVAAPAFAPSLPIGLQGFSVGLAFLVGVPLALTAVCTFLARTRPEFAFAAGICAGEAVLWAVAGEWSTYACLALLLALWAPLHRRTPALVGAALAGGGLVWALLGHAGMRTAEACAAGLAVASLLALLGEYGRSRKIKVSPAQVLAGLSALVVIDVVLEAVTSPLQYVIFSWDGWNTIVTTRPMALGALLLAGAVAVAAMKVRGVPGPWILAAGVAAGAVVVAAVPVTVALPYWAQLVVLLAGTFAAGAVAMRPGPRPAGAGVVLAAVATGLGSIAAVTSLAERDATLAVLPLLAVLAAVAAHVGRAKPLAVTLAAGLAAAEVFAVAEAAGLRTASLVGAGVGVVTIAVGFAVRNRAIGYLGTAFLLSASWMRLWADGVEVVEAYTLPFSLVLLGIGWWHARELSSWRAYGTGLLFTFLPSLLAEPTPVRSLMLGAAALAVVVSGTRMRLQAPVVLGSLTLGVVAVRELSPWVAELMVVVPKWIPIAVGGLLLIVVGATYEARKRDVVRLRTAVAGLR